MAVPESTVQTGSRSGGGAVPAWGGLPRLGQCGRWQSFNSRSVIEDQLLSYIGGGGQT